MNIKFNQEIAAEVVVTARLAKGEFSAAVTATCPYAEGELPGATASTHVALPPELAAAIEEAMRAAIEKVSPELGKKLSRSAAEAYRVSVAQKEIR